MNMKRIIAVITFFIIILSIFVPNIALAIETIDVETENENTTIEEDENVNNIESNVSDNETINNTENNVSSDKIENNVENNIDGNKEENSIEDSMVDNTTKNEETKIEENTDKNIQEENSILETQNLDTENVNTALSVSYRTHVENEGWQDYVQDGVTSGTTGKNLKLEAINIELLNNEEENLNIKYQVHVKNIGWQNEKQNGEMAGTTRQALNLEAIKIELENTEDYSIMYRVHIQNIGWQDWKTDGEIAGTEGRNLGLEAIEIKIVEKQKKGMLCIDTPANESTYYSKETSSINVSGWKMANVSNTYIKAYMDNTEVSSDKISYSKREDVIQAITGYGTAKENPTPGFGFSIDTSNLESGSHTLKIELYSGDTVLSALDTRFNLDENLHLQYRAHVENEGWQNYMQDGATAGTTGKNLELEAINIELLNNTDKNLKIKYEAHVENIGWQGEKQDGEMAGTTEQNLHIEAIKIELENSDDYSVMYRAHVQNIGWQDWKTDGEIAGTVGKDLGLEAIEIKIVKKSKIEVSYTYNEDRNTVTATINSRKQLSNISDSSWTLSEDKLSYSKEYDVNDIYEVTVTDIDGIEDVLQINITQVIDPISMVKYSSHIENYGWEKKYSKIDGDISGTTGENKKIEAIRISLGNKEEIPEGASIKYQVYVQDYGWQEEKKDGEIAGTTGENRRIEAIKIEIDGMEGYCVEYRTYIGNVGWQKWKSNGEIAGIIDEGKRIEAIQIRVIKKEEKTIEPNVEYQSYVQNDGWQQKVKEDEISGTTGQAKVIKGLKIYLEGADETSLVKYRTYSQNNWQEWKNSNEQEQTTEIANIQAIQIELENLEGYSIEYRVHISNYGWQKWRKNGETAGVPGNDIEAIQIRIVYEGTEKLEPEVSYQAHVQDIGWQEETTEGFMAGTEGQAKKIEAIKINLFENNSNQKVKYRAHVQDIGWQPWVSNGAMAGTTGQNKRIEAIQIELENMDEYTIEYQVHIEDYGWSDWMIDGETAGTTGEGKRIEAIRIRIVPKYYRRYNGIDVSEHNGLIDWQSVKNSGVQFAMIRCAYRGYRNPVIVKDKYFDYNVRNATAVGIKVGIYFFSQATSIGEAVEEANYAINLAKQYGKSITYPIAIDTESSGAENNDGRADGLDIALRTNVVAAFCNQVNNSGYIPMVYASKNWLYNNLEVTRLSTYETWLAHYTNNSEITSDYKYDYTMWQYTSSGYMPGIGGRVDLNIGYKKY